MDLSEKMKYEIEQLQHTRAQYERWLETAPEGSLYFHNNERGHNEYNCLITDKHGSFIKHQTLRKHVIFQEQRWSSQKSWR